MRNLIAEKWPSLMKIELEAGATLGLRHKPNLPCRYRMVLVHSRRGITADPAKLVCSVFVTMNK